MEASKRRRDALLQSFSAWLADRPRRPVRLATRQTYVSHIQCALAIAEKHGYSLYAGDVRTVRFILGHVSPHPATQNGYLSALRALYEFLQKQGLRADNPALEIGRPPRFVGMPRPLEVEDCIRYEAAALRLGPRYEIIACLGLYQGWRRSEMRYAEWSWFFEHDGRAWADVNGKGGKRARVPVHARTLSALQRLRADHRDPRWLLPSLAAVSAGDPVSAHWLRCAHLRICEAAGITEHLVLHQLRHSYATYLRKEGGADLAIVQLGMRHSSPSSTQIYMRIFPEELADAHTRLRYNADPAT